MKKLGILIFSLFMVSGCTDYFSLEEEIIVNNDRVRVVQQEYALSKGVGDGVLPQIKDYLLTGDFSLVSDKIGLSENHSSLRDLESHLEKLRSDFNTSINTINSNYQDAVEDYTLSGGSSINPDDLRKVDDVSKYLDEVLEVHYFIDDTTTIVDQMILLNLEQGNYARVSLDWLGGVFVGSEAHTNS